jgi:hypothetical protein
MDEPGTIEILRARLGDLAGTPKTSPRAAARAWAIFSLLRAAELLNVQRALLDDGFYFEIAQRELQGLFHQLGTLAADIPGLEDVARLSRGRLACTADVFFLREAAARRPGRSVTTSA